MMHGPQDEHHDGGDDDVQGDVARLRQFRAELYGCLGGWGDALFELGDAALCQPGPVSSVPALSLQSVFLRSHGSLYKSLERGQVDADAVRELLVTYRPGSWPLVFAVDASTWDRCDAETSPERGFYYSASKHSAGQPIVAGWAYQWITQLDWAHDSWTAPMDALRLDPRQDTTTATVEQIRRLRQRLPTATGAEPAAPAPLFVHDAGYDPIGLSHDLAADHVQVLVRIRDDRVFYTDPPPPGHGVGRPRRHGARFSCATAATWPTPDDELNVDDKRYGTVTMTAWSGLHPKLGRRGHWTGHQSPPIVRGTVIRVQVEHLPKPTARTKKTLWLWWTGPGTPDLQVCWRAYLRRFDIHRLVQPPTTPRRTRPRPTSGVRNQPLVPTPNQPLP